MPLRPDRQLAQFGDLGVGRRRVVRLRQAAGIIDARVSAHAAQKPISFLDQQTAEAPFAQRAVKEQEPRRVRRHLCSRQLLLRRSVEVLG